MNINMNGTRLPAFELTEAFFTTLEFRRTPEVPDALNVRFNVQVRVHGEKLPENLQVDLRLQTLENQPVHMVLELIGLFRGNPETSLEPAELTRFINERALFLLWSYIVQFTKAATAQMGMAPVRLKTPLDFQLYPEEEASQPQV